MSTKLNCASYLRLSLADDNKSDESSSISSQRMIIESFARFNNFCIVDEYIDDGYSGGNFDRPAFMRMLEDIKKRKINCVITKDLSRLGREIYKTGEYIEQYFLENDVRYIAINDSYDSEIGDTMLGIRLSVNDLYLRDVSKKVKSSLKIKQNNGEYIGSFPCYGYKKNPEDKHKLIPDDKVVSIVKMIYELALEGYGSHTICAKLTDLKIPIPIVYKGEPRGKKVTDNDGLGIWKHSTVRNILTSEMYIGNMVQHTYAKVSYHSKKLRKVDQSEQIIVKNTHEAIISKEDFDKVQELLKKRSKFNRGKEKKYLFTGLLKCKECGATLSISEKINKKDNSHFTQCNLYRKKGKYGVCTQHRVNYNLLEKDLLEIIKNECEKFLNDYNPETIIKKANNMYDNNSKILKDEIVTIEKGLSTNRNIIDNLYKDKINNTLSQEDFNRMYETYSKENQSLIVRKNDLEKKITELNEEYSKLDYEKCKHSVERFMSMDNPTNNVISRLVKKITVSENKEIEIYFNYKEFVAL
ncbi:MAG: recombinase family protein [Bacilli bacterium]